MLADSKQKEISPESIITIDAKNNRSPHPAATMYAAVVAEMNMPQTGVLRHGNTLMILHYADEGVGVFKAINADTPDNYIDNLVYCFKAAYNMGYDTLYSVFDEESDIAILRKVATAMNDPEYGHMVKKLDDDNFSVTIKLGAERGKQ